MELSDIKKYLRRFFRGDETEAGRSLIDIWYHHFDHASDKLADGLSETEKEELRKELLTKVRMSAGYWDTSRKFRCYRHWSNRTAGIVKMAAGFIIILLILVPFLPYEDLLDFGGQSAQVVEYRTARNPVGQTSKITLADGSTVWLSAASILKYPTRFSDSLRHVYLKGEAFFDVAKNAEKPFIVNSEGLETRVLGTSFNVRVFEGEDNILVTVASGKVSVRQKGVAADSLKESVNPTTILQPDQQLVFNKEDRLASTQTVNSTLYTSWKDGRLIFENHSFEEIARRLEQWYGVRFHFSNMALKQERFKIVFENTSLEYALRMLQVIKEFEFNIKDRQVWIRPSG